MEGSWERIHNLYEEALAQVQEAKGEAETKGHFTKATVARDSGLILYREEGIGKMLKFPHFTCGDPTTTEARKAADLLYVAGFGTNEKLRAFMALDRVTLIRHSNGRVFMRGIGSDKAAVPPQ